MKVIDIARQFCTRQIFDSTVCVVVGDEDMIFNPGDSLSDLSDLASKTVKHCYVEERVLFIEVVDLNTRRLKCKQLETLEEKN